jgi:cytochrome c-type biogenesis protein CcmH
MMLSIALTMLGATAGIAAVAVFLIRHVIGASDQLSLALAQSGSACLAELERCERGASPDAAAADNERVEALRELLEAARTGQSRYWLIRGDRGALIAVGLSALAMGCFLLLLAVDRADPAAHPEFAASTTVQKSDLARLADYVRSTPARPRSTAAMSTPGDLPDVETMIERLEARLQTAPDDAEGWRMLGWSYFNTGHASKAAAAYARAVALLPQSSELKSAYSEALAAAESDTNTDGPRQPIAEQMQSTQALPAEQQQAMIRGMVNGLADRLKKEPRDEEGWLRLLRSRTVLGEQQAARESLALALAAFADDASATGRISAMAKELGLVND